MVTCFPQYYQIVEENDKVLADRFYDDTLWEVLRLYISTKT